MFGMILGSFINCSVYLRVVLEKRVQMQQEWVRREIVREVVSVAG